VLTKFDTIDDKVGSAISMTYISGQPIGNHYFFKGRVAQDLLQVFFLTVNEVIVLRRLKHIWGVLFVGKMEKRGRVFSHKLKCPAVLDKKKFEDVTASVIIIAVKKKLTHFLFTVFVGTGQTYTDLKSLNAKVSGLV
jgi:signal recognition particle GTPase